MADIVEEKTHAKLSPSGASRWTRCPGSVILSEGKPNRSSHYARWGTVAHEVAGLILGELAETKGLAEWRPRDAEGFVGRVFEVEGHKLEFDMEMADCVNDYVAHVEAYWAPGDILIIEQSVPLAHITGERGATGTSDCIIIKPSSGEIVVIDLKGGKGVVVDAYTEDDEGNEIGNEQGVMYASGSIEEHDLFHGPFKHVCVVIIQPRAQHVSEWRADIEEFNRQVDLLRDAAARVQTLIALAPYNILGPDLRPGEKQCRFCDAKPDCPALAGAVTGALALTAPPAKAEEFPDLTLAKQAAAGAAVDHGVPATRLAEAMRAAPLVEQWLGAVRAEVERRLFDGQDVPGFYLGVGKRGNRAWSDKAQAEVRLRKAKGLKVDDIFTRSLISVTAAEKLLKGNPKAWATLATLITQADGKPSVCKIGDKNEPYSITPAPEDFPVVEDDEVDIFA